MKINVSNGKYTFSTDGDAGVIDIFRGDPDRVWVSLHTGFNAVFSLMAALDAARVVVKAARDLGDAAPPEIKRALEVYRGLVDDNEPPSEWATSPLVTS